MTTILLIRHGRHDLLGRVLTGRAPGVHLNAEGLREAEGLVGRLAGVPIDAVYSSPMERAWETAAPLAEDREVEVVVSKGFMEIEFGGWTSRTFAELDPLPEWRSWNEARDQARPPGGETMCDVMARAFGALLEIARVHEGQTVAVFSHGDVIKGALMRCLGIPINNHALLEISPASISIVRVENGVATVHCVNCETATGTIRR